MIKAYKYKLKLTNAQEQRVKQWTGTCRYVYNLAKEAQELSRELGGGFIHKYNLIKQIKDIRKEADWIRDVPFECLEFTIKRLDKTYQDFFNGNGYPKWAKKGRYRSIKFRQHIKQKPYSFRLPKIGWVRVYKDRLPKGKLKQAVIKKEVDGYYLSVYSDEKIAPTKPSENQAVGIDVGVTHLATLSTGEHIANPRVLDQYKDKLRRKKRKLARQNKGSNRREETKRQIGRLYLKIKRAREDYLQKVTTDIVERFPSIYIENLNVSGMTQGNRGLNRSMLDASFGRFAEMLKYKCEWYGREFEKVDPKYTSQTCPECGTVDSDNRKTQSEFKCIECGHSENADVVAAKNIKGRGTVCERKRKAVA